LHSACPAPARSGEYDSLIRTKVARSDRVPGPDTQNDRGLLAPAYRCEFKLIFGPDFPVLNNNFSLQKKLRLIMRNACAAAVFLVLSAAEYPEIAKFPVFFPAGG
ncbi:MAG: hypothetical protein ACREDL_13990, partial [Bradyrhizobium sp.]